MKNIDFIKKMCVPRLPEYSYVVMEKNIFKCKPCPCFFVPLETFSLVLAVTITGWGLQILTYSWHSWLLSSEGSLACHTYCDTGHSFKIVISEDPRHLHLLPRVWQWSCCYLFLRLESVVAGIRTPNPQLARRTL